MKDILLMGLMGLITAIGKNALQHILGGQQLTVSGMIQESVIAVVIFVVGALISRWKSSKSEGGI